MENFIDIGRSFNCDDCYLEILSEGSAGQVIVDAVRFLKINY